MGLGDAMSGLFGSKNEFQAQPTKLDSTAYQYGADHGGTEAADAARYSGLAQAAQNRQGPQINMGQANAARAQQSSAMGLQAAAANGSAPSAAAAQQQQGLDAATRAQYAAAGSARGAGGVATAQYNAGQNAAGMSQQAVSQAAQLRAQEMAQARDSYASSANAMRSQDLGGATSQAQLEAGQRGQNDQYSLAQYNNEQAVRHAGMQGAMAQQAQQSQNQQASDQINAGVAQQNAAQNNSNGGSLLSAAGSIAGMAAMSDERVKTDVRDESGPNGSGSDVFDAPTVLSAAPGGAPMYMAPEDKKGNYGFAGNFQQEKGGLGGLEKGQAAAGGVGANEGGPKSGEGVAALLPMLKNLGKGGAGAGGGAATSSVGSGKPLVADDDNEVWTGNSGTAADLSSGAGEDMASSGLADAAMSDKRSKGDVTAQKAAPARMLAALHPVSFRYKEGVGGENPRERRFGIMAQDLERSPMGASIVVEGPQGKMINTKHAPGVLLAALANMHDRVAALEGRGDTRKKSSARRSAR